MQWQSIILTSIGSGIVSVVVVLLKQFYDRRTEEQKAKLVRASWVHQRQVDCLSGIYSRLYEVQDLLRGATRAGRLTNEAPPEKYLAVLREKWTQAVSKFVDSKLIVPKDIADKCDAFFGLLQDAEIQLAIGKESLRAGDGLEHAERWGEAGKIAHTKIPALLVEIERSARQIIHEESKSPQV
ncbi:MAG: hypothetical protein P4L03_07060 [Terracidiphilus sp.]|nr:hypothetical protein [Terracidiphilus sp.]